MVKQIPDIPRIKAHWERRSDPLPYLTVPMSDGTVIRYNAEVKQPGFVQAMENVRHMVGYEKTGDAATSTGHRENNTVVSIPQKEKS